MTKPKYMALLAAVLLILTIAAYSNHFHNAFHFDDSHTIINNLYLRNISNIPLFFKDSTTFSSLPSNQSYRPMVTATLAIDYWLGKGLSDTFYFHLSMFIMFLLQGMVMYVLYLKIFNQGENGNRNRLVALLAVGWYLLHPANAETINYIISRSDSYSALFIVLALVLFIRSAFCRKWQIYLLPVVLGVLTKPITAVFPLLLLLYILLFEENCSLAELFNRTGLNQLLGACRKTVPAFLLIIAMMIVVKIMEPATWSPGGASKFNYLITQPYVILRYFLTFFFPVSLSADTDLAPFASMADIRFYTGILFIAAMLAVAILTSKTARLRPIAFGILWFLITLVPTSVIPLAEVMNDHRTFLPYIGLMLSVCWSANLGLDRLRQLSSSSVLINRAATVVIASLLAASCYGTHRRNDVWKTEESLWKDVTEKSPRNGRGLMNYGLVLMARGDYAGTEKYYLKALEFNPNYGILHTNLAIMYAATGRTDEAETFFNKAISLQPQFPDVYVYYGRYLKNKKRYAEAVIFLEKATQLTASHMDARYLLMESYLGLGDFSKVSQIAEETLRIVPGDKRTSMLLNIVRSGSSKEEILAAIESVPDTPEYFLNLSLGYYREGDFRKCISAAEKALQLRPGYDLAYNNICSASIELKEWNKAVVAGEKAVQFNPSNELARNNLARAKAHEPLLHSNNNTQSGKTPEELLSLSLAYYQAKDYPKSIEAAESAIKARPDYGLAFNNICAAYNALGQWDKAILAGERAVRLNPESELARNNLAWAKSQKLARSAAGNTDSK